MSGSIVANMHLLGLGGATVAILVVIAAAAAAIRQWLLRRRRAAYRRLHQVAGLPAPQHSGVGDDDDTEPLERYPGTTGTPVLPQRPDVRT
jgi:hypothetical protein